MFVCTLVQLHEEDVRFPGARITGSCELPKRDAGTKLSKQSISLTAEQLFLLALIVNLTKSIVIQEENPQLRNCLDQVGLRA